MAIPLFECVLHVHILDVEQEFSLVSGLDLVDVSAINQILGSPGVESVIIRACTDVEGETRNRSSHLFCGFVRELFAGNLAMECVVHLESLTGGRGQQCTALLTVLGADCLLLWYRTPTSDSDGAPRAPFATNELKSAGDKAAISLESVGCTEDSLPRSNRLKRIKSTQQIAMTTGSAAPSLSAAPAPTQPKSHLRDFLSSIVSEESKANSASELSELHSAHSGSRSGTSSAGTTLKGKTGSLHDKTSSNLSAGSNSNSADGKSISGFCGGDEGDSLMYSPAGTNIGSKLPGSQGHSSNSKSVIFGLYRDGGESRSMSMGKIGADDTTGVPAAISSVVRPMSLFSTVITGAASAVSSGTLAPSVSSTSVGSSVGNSAPTATPDTEASVPLSGNGSASANPCAALTALLDQCFETPELSPVWTGLQLAGLVLDCSVELVEADRQRNGGTAAVGTKRSLQMQAFLDQCHNTVSDRLKSQLSAAPVDGLFSRKLIQLWALCVGLVYNLQLVHLLCSKPPFPSLAKLSAKKASTKKDKLELTGSWKGAVKLLKKSVVKYANSRAEGVFSRLSILLGSYLSFSENFSDNIKYSALGVGNTGSKETVGDIHCLPCLLCVTSLADRSPRPGPDEVITSSVLVNNCASMVRLLDCIDDLCGDDSGLFSAIETHCSISSALVEHHPRFIRASAGGPENGDVDEDGGAEGSGPGRVGTTHSPSTVSGGDGNPGLNSGESTSTTTGSTTDIVSLVETNCCVESGLSGASNTGASLSYPEFIVPTYVLSPAETVPLAAAGAADIQNPPQTGTMAPPTTTGGGISLVRTNSLLSVQRKVDSRTGVKPLKLVSMRETNYRAGSGAGTSAPCASASSSASMGLSRVEVGNSKQNPRETGRSATSAESSAASARTISGSGRSKSLMNSITDLKRPSVGTNSGGEKRPRRGESSAAAFAMPAPGRSICIPETPDSVQRSGGKNRKGVDISSQGPDATSRKLAFSTL